MRRSARSIAILASVALLAGACQTTGPEPTPGLTLDASPVASASGSDAPEATVGRTAVPGFEDWETINPQAVRISLDAPAADGEEPALTMELIGSRLWFNTERGVLFGKDVTGDFRATATVRTSKRSDADTPPGGDGSIQLAGLMAHATGPIENYVFIVIGSIGQSTGVETKTTTAGHSIWVQRGPITNGAADLRLCRSGRVFTLWWRAAGSSGDWTLQSTFEREDLAETLSVGPNIYTDGAPDITARFEALAIEALQPGEGC
ncbi:MAG TPA: hypothetical protein VM451_09235 [Candidatus Limnocylindria bacterium]|nr:hypothetical protein [Candidatus Limnocylindria bacterium]